MSSLSNTPPQANQEEQSSGHHSSLLIHLLNPPPPYLPRSSAELPFGFSYPTTAMTTYSAIQKNMKGNDDPDAKKVHFAVESGDEEPDFDAMLEEGDRNEFGRKRLARCSRGYESNGGWLEDCTWGEKVVYILVVLSAILNAVTIFASWGAESELREVKFCLAEQADTYPRTRLWRIASEQDNWGCLESFTVLALADEYEEVADMEHQGTLSRDAWADNQ